MFLDANRVSLWTHCELISYINGLAPCCFNTRGQRLIGCPLVTSSVFRYPECTAAWLLTSRLFPQSSHLDRRLLFLSSDWTAAWLRASPSQAAMSSNIKVSLDNPYGHVTIPRAKLRPSDSDATVIANPTALGSGEGNSYATSSAPPPYMVKEDGGGDEEEAGRCRACCYRCRRRKWCHQRRLVIGSWMFVLMYWSFKMFSSSFPSRKEKKTSEGKETKEVCEEKEETGSLFVS